MKIKLIEGNEYKELLYRAWNGIQYGPNDAERIVKQYSNAPFDRSAGAFIMSKGEYRFWETYLSDLSEDEKHIREAYLTYHPADVEDYLRKELDLVGDDPRVHHKARQAALTALAKDFPAQAKALAKREPKGDYEIKLRLGLRNDADLIDRMRKAERMGEGRTATIKRLMRIGLQYEAQIHAEREAALTNLRKTSWFTKA